MTLSELDKLQATASDSYSKVQEAFVAKKENLSELKDIAEKHLQEYLDKVMEVTDWIGEGKFPSDFRFSCDPLDPAFEFKKIDAFRNDLRRRQEWIFPKMRNLEALEHKMG